MNEDIMILKESVNWKMFVLVILLFLLCAIKTSVADVPSKINYQSIFEVP